MSARALYRVAALALFAAAVSMVAGRWTHPPSGVASFGGPLWVLSHALLWAGSAAAVVGLVALYLRQRERLGRFGLVGAALACLGLAALSGAFYFEAVLVPSLAAGAREVMLGFPAAAMWRPYLVVIAVSGGVVAVGFVMFGVASYRAAILPRWAVAVASAGAIATGLQFLLPGPLPLFAFGVLGIGLAALGQALWAAVDGDRAPVPAGTPRITYKRS